MPQPLLPTSTHPHTSRYTPCFEATAILGPVHVTMGFLLLWRLMKIKSALRHGLRGNPAPLPPWHGTVWSTRGGLRGTGEDGPTRNPKAEHRHTMQP